jgi:hypothetical protein
MYNSDLPARAELPSSKQLLRSTIVAIVVPAFCLTGEYRSVKRVA